MGLENCLRVNYWESPNQTSSLTLKYDWLVLPGKKEKGAKLFFFFLLSCASWCVFLGTASSALIRATQV